MKHAARSDRVWYTDADGQHEIPLCLHGVSDGREVLSAESVDALGEEYVASVRKAARALGFDLDYDDAGSLVAYSRGEA